MERRIKEWKFGSLPGKIDLTVLQLKLSEDDIHQRLEEGQEKLRPVLVQSIQKATRNYQDRLVECIDRAVEQVIRDTSILEQVRSVGAD